MRKERQTLEFVPFSERDPFEQSILIRTVAAKLGFAEWIIAGTMRDLDTRYALTPNAVYIHPADQGEFHMQVMRMMAEVQEA